MMMSMFALRLMGFQGARGLRSILEKVLMQAMFEIPDAPDVTGVIVDRDSIHSHRYVDTHHHHHHHTLKLCGESPKACPVNGW